MEEKHMESLYCLMNINTERITFKYLVTFIPLPQVPTRGLGALYRAQEYH